MHLPRSPRGTVPHAEATVSAACCTVHADDSVLGGRTAVWTCIFPSLPAPLGLLESPTVDICAVGWAGNQEPCGDMEDWQMCREQILTDALDHCYGILRLQYFAFAGRLISTANTWQKAEACLYLVRCVALSVKSRVLSGGCPAPLRPAFHSADCANSKPCTPHEMAVPLRSLPAASGTVGPCAYGAAPPLSSLCHPLHRTHA